MFNIENLSDLEIKKIKSENETLNEREHKNGQLILNSYPYYLTLMNTSRCNLSCVMCPRRGQKMVEKDMDENLLNKIIGEIFIYLDSLQLSVSSEPLVAENFPKILESSKRYRIPNVEIMTNGLMLDREELVRLICENVTHLVFSMDGATPGTANRIRKGLDFNKWLENIKFFNELSEKKFKKRPFVAASYAIMKSNITEVPDFIRLAKKLKVDLVHLQHLIAYQKENQSESLLYEKKMSNEYLKQALQLAKELGIILECPPLYAEETSSVPEASETEPPKIKLASSPCENVFKEEFEVKADCPATNGGNDGQQNLLVNLNCRDPWFRTYIEINGEVVPCCSTWMLMGNIDQSDGFLKIWNGLKYQDLRRGIVEGQPQECCQHCFLRKENVTDERSILKYNSLSV